MPSDGLVDELCWQKVSLPPQCEGELMQATPCGLVTSSGERRDLWFVLFRS